jgi:hypothetical protein
MPTTESGRLRSRLGHRRMGTVAHPREIPRRTQNAALVVELLARLFAAIGSYPQLAVHAVLIRTAWDPLQKNEQKKIGRAPSSRLE